MQFNEFEVKEYVAKALNDLDFKELTPIQKEVLRNKKVNFIAKSKTGTGKTHAFLIPIFNALDEKEKKLQAVIVAPTNELASQIFRMAKQIASFSGDKIDIRLYSASKDRLDDLEKLNQEPQIVIGTPGRIYDYAIKERRLPIYKASFAVVDEADMTFDQGFIEEVWEIIKEMSKANKWVFSATFNEEVKKMLYKIIPNLKEIFIDSRKSQITHILLPIKSQDKYDVFINLTKVLNPYLSLVFLNTKERAIDLYNKVSNKINCCLIHGGLDPRTRKRIIREISELKYQYIIATDIAARGIDIVGVSHVINYDLPSDYEFYIHRTGRTGRAQFTGMAISLYDFDNKEYIKKIEEKGVNFVYKTIKNGELTDYRKSISKMITLPRKPKNTPRYLSRRR